MEQYKTNAICPKCGEMTLSTSTNDRTFLECTNCNKKFPKGEIHNFASKEVFIINMPLNKPVWQKNKYKLTKTAEDYNVYMLGFDNLKEEMCISFDILHNPDIPSAKQLLNLFKQFNKDIEKAKKEYTKQSSLSAVTNYLDSVQYCYYNNSLAATRFLDNIDEALKKCSRYSVYNDLKQQVEETKERIKALPDMPVINFDLDEGQNDQNETSDFVSDKSDTINESDVTTKSDEPDNSTKESNSESEIIKETYKKSGISDLSELSKININENKTKQTNTNKNQLNNNTVTRPWTPEEDEILKTNYSSKTIDELSDIIPGRTPGACKARAKKLKLHKN